MPIIIVPKSKSKSKSSKAIVLISRDCKKFNVDEDVAMKSELVKMIYGDNQENGYRDPHPLELKQVPSEILRIVIDYCKKLVNETAHEDLKAEFLQLEPRILFGLIIAAIYMRIRSLMELSSQVVVEFINDLTPDEIYKTLEIKNDFTTKEADDIYVSEPWPFKEKSSTLTKEEQKRSFLQKVLPSLCAHDFGCLTNEEKRKWVLVAVLIPNMRRLIESAKRECKLFLPSDDDLDTKSNSSETIELDLSDLYVEDPKDKDKDKKKKKKKKKNYYVA